MGDFEHPKLKCIETGCIVELNSNPFSIGRGLTCNFVITKKPVSRVHCILEKNEEGWILKDTSTNGSTVNGQLLKGIKSSLLKDGDIIKLDMTGESYVFHTGRRNQCDDITDEQLCSIADSVLDRLEACQQQTRNQDNAHQFPNENVNITNSDSNTMNAALEDHLSMAKPVQEHLNKKQKTEVGTTMAADTSHTSPMNLMQDSGTSTTNALVGTSDVALSTPLVDLSLNTSDTSANSSTDKPVPTASTAAEPPDVTSANDAGNPVQPPQAVAIDQQDTYEVMENELQCAICSELFVKAVTLQCSHTFCKYCIEMWKKNKSECPICRNKITGMTSTLVLDNIIEKVMESSSKETQQRRKQMLDERKALENAKPPERPNTRSRGRGNGGRGRGGRTDNSGQVAHGVGNPVEMRSHSNPVIEVSSDSDLDDDSDSDSNDTTEWRDEYEDDDWYAQDDYETWYDDGVPGTFYGGYGHCYSCGRRGHWANGCPFR